MINENLGFEW